VNTNIACATGRVNRVPVRHVPLLDDPPWSMPTRTRPTIESFFSRCRARRCAPHSGTQARAIRPGDALAVLFVRASGPVTTSNLEGKGKSPPRWA